MTSPDITAALEVFSAACRYSESGDVAGEVEWHRALKFENFSETDLLRETAWVVLCSGFRENIIRERFGYISLCFCDWESAREIVDAEPHCSITAKSAFGNEKKLLAIADAAAYIDREGFDLVKLAIQDDPIVELQRFPHIGPITVFHLAKNLGLDVVKPDRHLSRLATLLGFESPLEFCVAISRKTGETRRVVDIVIWRYLADNQDMFR